TSPMPNDFAEVFKALKPILEKHAGKFKVTADSAAAYSLDTQKPSPFPQHKGHGLAFAAIKPGKSYVSFHLVAIYMSDTLQDLVSPALRKRMQGKACFNFKTVPEKEILNDLRTLTAACVKDWQGRGWM